MSNESQASLAIELIRPAEYARLRKVSRVAISKLIKRGVLTLRDKKLNVAEADAACLQHLNIAKSQVLAGIEAAPAGSKPGAARVEPGVVATAAVTAESGASAAPDSPPKPKFSFNDARAEREHYEALFAKNKYLEQQGTLVSALEVSKEILEVGREVREQLMNISPRISPVLAAETDERKVDELLTKEIRQICDDLANKFANRRGGTD